MSAWLNDETWSRLDPRGAHLSRRERVAVGAIAIVGVLVVGTGLAAAHAGVFVPHVDGSYEELTGPPGTHGFTETIGVEASGTIDEQMIGVRSATPGVAVTAVTPFPVHRAAQGNVVSLRLRFEITDCTAARSSNDLAVTLRFHRFWGTVTRTITPNGPELQVDPIAIACAR